MRKLLTILSLFLFFFSNFSLLALAADEDIALKKPSSSPEWANDPYAGSKCHKMTHICAVGVATGRMLAQGNARREMALIFEAKISGSKSMSKSTSQDSDESGAILRASSGESFFSEMKETTDQVLSGLEILETADDKDNVYALAALDRSRASAILVEKMKGLDDIMKDLLKDQGRGVYRKLLRQYALREQLNTQYQIINNGGAYPKVITWSQIQERKNSKQVGVGILIPSKDIAYSLVPFLAQLLTENDYSVSNKKEGTTFTLDGNLSSEDQFLKVEGFVRFKFTLDLHFINGEGKKVFVTSKIVTTDGRTFEDAKAKALKELEEYLKEQWKDISIH